jgi:hypothetical protein
MAVVEARPTGSCAASVSRLFASAALRPAAPGLPGKLPVSSLALHRYVGG